MFYKETLNIADVQCSVYSAQKLLKIETQNSEYLTAAKTPKFIVLTNVFPLMAF